MRVTIKQIADIAGVHRATVDKVIHNRPGVSDEVREKIQAIIDELGYKPNPIGKALARQNKPIRIAVVLLRTDSRIELRAGVQRASEEFSTYGLEINVLMSGIDDNELVSVLDVVSSGEYDGVVVQPTDSDQVRDRIDRLSSAGKPVVAVNTDIRDCSRLCYVGQDMTTAGRTAGELMGQVLSGKGKVAIVTSSDTLLSSREREEAFEKLLEERYGDIIIVDVVYTHEEKQATFLKTLEMLKNSKDLAGIYITCGNVEDVGKAIKIDGKHKDIKVISHDVYPGIIALMKNSVINFTLDQKLEEQGYLAVKVLFEKLFNSQNPPSDQVITQTVIKIKENL